MNGLKNARKILGNKGIKPKKGLGQNFLVEAGIIQKLIVAANIQPGETIIEIGPGTGNLTQELVKTGNKIIAIEKDTDMVVILKEKLKDTGANNIEILNENALLYQETKIATPYKIAANLPFYLTAPIIRKFLESANPPRSMTVIVQKEVAQRVCANPPEMSLLAISVQFYAQAKKVCNISKNCFWPAPKVECAILQINLLPKTGERIDKPFINQFFKIVRAGFSHPRKQLINNLSNELKVERGLAEKWLAASDLQPNRRAETLTVENWVSLTKTFEL